MTIGDQVSIKTNGKDGVVIGDYVEPNGTVHYKVRFFIPNSSYPNMGYMEEFGSFFLEHELEGKGG
jgi:hypothetical protein